MVVVLLFYSTWTLYQISHLQKMSTTFSNERERYFPIYLWQPILCDWQMQITDSSLHARFANIRYVDSVFLSVEEECVH